LAGNLMRNGGKGNVRLTVARVRAMQGKITGGHDGLENAG
jgi:hypothetical protein